MRLAKAVSLVHKFWVVAGMRMGADMDKALEKLVYAALPHVAFDGWSQAALAEAAADSGLSLAEAEALVPRGGVDLALAYHHLGDAQMVTALQARDLQSMRFRDRVTLAVRLRLTDADAEVVRRGTALFALPLYAADGARALWGTADAIWVALGDTSTDVNWYSKRATLSAVYAATVLYWLGDDSPDHEATWAFLDRRIANVMAFEKAKASFNANPMGKALMEGPLAFFDRIRAPNAAQDLPGYHRKGL
jgi:ubiquinone biosynthesis protein COQ9